MVATLAALIVAISLLFAPPSQAYSMTIWSYEGAKSKLLHFNFTETQWCYAFDSCALAKVSFAEWTNLPEKSQMLFYRDAQCTAQAYGAMDYGPTSVSFHKAGVNVSLLAAFKLFEVYGDSTGGIQDLCLGDSVSVVS